jgi:ABC-2 type transport system ATP-binding protein
VDKYALEVRRLSKKYDEFLALTETSFSIHQGRIISIVGSNGAGKSTLLRCISGYLNPTTGVVRVNGCDLYKDEVSFKRRLAFLPDTPVFYPELTVWEHFTFIAHAFHITEDFNRRATSILQSLEMDNAHNLLPHALSHGMRKKAALSLLLLRPFSVLLLDEPRSGLDPKSVRTLEEMLSESRDNGAAIILATHDISFAERLSNEIWNIVQGKLLFDEQSHSDSTPIPIKG